MISTEGLMDLVLGDWLQKLADGAYKILGCIGGLGQILSLLLWLKKKCWDKEEDKDIIMISKNSLHQSRVIHGMNLGQVNESFDPNDSLKSSQCTCECMYSLQQPYNLNGC